MVGARFEMFKDLAGREERPETAFAWGFHLKGKCNVHEREKSESSLGSEDENNTRDIQERRCVCIGVEATTYLTQYPPSSQEATTIS
jgi:hypothetical protein